MAGRVFNGTIEGMIHDETTNCGAAAAALSGRRDLSGQLSMWFVGLSIPCGNPLWNKWSMIITQLDKAPPTPRFR